MLHSNHYLLPVKSFFITLFAFNLSTIIPTKSSTTLDTSANNSKSHTDRINVIKWSPDGNFIASAGGIDTDYNTGRKPGNEEQADYNIRIWNAHNGKFVSFSHGNNFRTIHKNAIKELQWSFNSSELLSASLDGTIRLWGKNKKNSLWSFKRKIYTSKSRITCMSWSPDNCYIALGSEDSKVRICFIPVNESFLLRLIDGYYYYHARPSSNSSVKYASSDKNSSKEKPIPTKRSQNVLPILNKDVKKLIMLYYPKKSKQVFLHKYKGKNEEAQSISWSSNGLYLAFGLYSNRGQVHVWNNKKQCVIKTTNNHNRPVTCVTWSNDSNLLISTSWDKELLVWDPATGNKQIKPKMKHQKKEDLRKTDRKIYNASVSFDDQYIASGDASGMVCVWNANTGELIHRLENEKRVEQVTWAPKSYLLACRRDKQVWVWDGKAGKGKYVLTHIDIVKSTEWSPNGNRIATASDDHTLCIWDSETGDLQKTCGTVYDYEAMKHSKEKEDDDEKEEEEEDDDDDDSDSYGDRVE